VTSVTKKATGRGLVDRLSYLFLIGVFLIGIIQPSEAAIDLQTAPKDTSASYAEIVFVDHGAGEVKVSEALLPFNSMPPIRVDCGQSKTIWDSIVQIHHLAGAEGDSTKIIVIEGSEGSHSATSENPFCGTPTLDHFCRGSSNINQHVVDFISFAMNVAEDDFRSVSSNVFDIGQSGLLVSHPNQESGKYSKKDSSGSSPLVRGNAWDYLFYSSDYDAFWRGAKVLIVVFVFLLLFAAWCDVLDNAGLKRHHKR
jgi:hypothetical protein